MLCLKVNISYYSETQEGRERNDDVLTLMPDLVYQLDNDVRLAHGCTVKVLPYRQGQLLFRYPSLVLPPSHGW